MALGFGRGEETALTRKSFFLSFIFVSFRVGSLSTLTSLSSLFDFSLYHLTLTLLPPTIHAALQNFTRDESNWFDNFTP